MNIYFATLRLYFKQNVMKSSLSIESFEISQEHPVQSIRQDSGNPSFFPGEYKDTIVVKDIHRFFLVLYFLLQPYSI